MPIYEYQCDSCSECCEKLQKISEPPITTCPACHQESLRRLISPSGFHLKGGGWYVTDFRNKEKPKEKPDSTKTTEAKSETKSKPKESDSDDSS